MPDLAFARLAASNAVRIGRPGSVARRRAARDHLAVWRAFTLLSLLLLGALLFAPGRAQPQEPPPAAATEMVPPTPSV